MDFNSNSGNNNNQKCRLPAGRGAAPSADHLGGKPGILNGSLDDIFSHTPAIIYTYRVIDGQMALGYVSRNVTDMLEYSPQEIMADPELWIGRIHPADRRKLRSIPGLLEGEQLVQLEYRFNCRKGNCLWLREKHTVISNSGSEKEVIAVSWDITERKQAERLIRARANLLSFSHTHTPVEILRETLKEVCAVLSSTRGFYCLLGEDGEVALEARFAAPPESPPRPAPPEGGGYSHTATGLCTDCLRQRRPLIRNGCSASPPHRVSRELVAPVMRRDRAVAVLGIANKPHQYTPRDIQNATYLADVAYSIVSHKLSKGEYRYLNFHDQLTGLYNRAFLEEEMKRYDDSGQAPLSLIMADLNGLKLINDSRGHGEGDRMLKTIAAILKSTCRRGDLIGRWGGDEFVILLPRTPESGAEEICRRIQQRCRRDRPGEKGVSLALGYATREDGGTPLQALLKAAEDYMHQQKLAESSSTKGAIVNAFLKTLGAKTFETEKHVRGMEAMAREMGERLGLLDPELNRLNLLITLHDIGKITIPKEILTKKGALTAEEWAIIKEHPETGYAIARSVEEFAHVAEEILSHHERWDGTGYPRGLKGEAIPLLARITAIIDAYEVMANGRPYKERMTPQEIIREFEDCAGTQFDPELVKLFLTTIVRGR